ncbi:hypothetical protein [Blautia sp. MSJ-9]|uniref:hypothetical protein n=1 Tax=Blautia sp. MSJ-9 TaxID=2841511 RepID=UPI001C0FA67B|nr:hypothetical protein [Blautia sp. MSJ-9]MBU5678997.1 hypothetical protein [Blautia sp. MSJ-9]
MGHKKKNSDNRDLHQQAYDRLQRMQHFGDSKTEDKKYDREHDTDKVSGKIYSFSTYKTYWKHIKYFLRYVKNHYPECRKLDKAQKYVAEWLQTRVDEGKSAWTIQTEAAALNKLYGIKKDDPQRFQPPRRKKEDIVRSRGRKERDKHFSEAKNEELVNFCKGCGFRRNVLEKLKGSDLYDRRQVEASLKDARMYGDYPMIKACKDALETFPDKEYFVLHRSDKGGKMRISPIVGPNMEKIVDRMRNTKSDELVWQYVSANCDVHGYRSDYATYLYKEYARPMEELSFENKIKCSDGKYRSEIYVCRGDERGKKLDRKAIGVISIALGHNREDTAISNYIRNL